ncbi:MAG: hypothetical protein RLZZ324_1094 [Candidatus Parcubacteria bacterium]|jgi:hypothetical protein
MPTQNARIPIMLVFAALGLTACNEAPAKAAPEDPVEKLERKAQEAGERAARETVEPNEIEMIAYRRKLMGKSGLQMYVVLLSRSGQPIDYFVTKGKCTSSKKRLTPTHKLVDSGPNSVVVKAAAEDGTHGTSGEYIYCRTADGKYKQWNGRYYASDSPIELTIKPLVLDMSGKNQHQQ